MVVYFISLLPHRSWNSNSAFFAEKLSWTKQSAEADAFPHLFSGLGGFRPGWKRSYNFGDLKRIKNYLRELAKKCKKNYREGSQYNMNCLPN